MLVLPTTLFKRGISVTHVGDGGEKAHGWLPTTESVLQRVKGLLPPFYGRRQAQV